jgi:hypothetical protein
LQPGQWSGEFLVYNGKDEGSLEEESQLCAAMVWEPNNNTTLELVNTKSMQPIAIRQGYCTMMTQQRIGF